ncbi:MAG TPA: hypothetical protein PKZ77_03245 [Pseudomonadales bacterium]|nr:hypothetical protein [Pseudomonadales bacterium]HMV71225.1 hypothetical protein [Pseudomonadales bacterium]HNC69478.1 hypothetical protein [Pseudomonadales bacterium]HND14658.1 hypothetical protein [Pseudomonadales bacterium]
MKNAITARLAVAALGLALLAPWYADAQPVEEDPGFMAMTGDLLVARPLLLVTTVAGTAAFLVSLPFTASGGNTHQAAEVLVAGPARQTFARCLGCRASTAKPRDRE